MKIGMNQGKPRAQFTREGYHFIVRPDNVLVYDRRWGKENSISLNVSATEDRASYDARRYQIKKNQNLINSIQTVMNA